MRSNRIFFVVVAFALAAAACGGDDEATTTTPATTDATTTTSTPTAITTSRASTTTSTSTTTTTTVIGGPLAPLTGLPVEDETLTERRVLAVKVDNHPNARPQSGIETADAVVEILVEGGLTRFIALFHTTDTDYVGPIRSARPTDPTILRPMNAVFTISGGQSWIVNYIAARGVKMIGEVDGTYRISTRSAPHNLYGDTDALRATADGRGYSDEFGVPLYEIAPWEDMPQETAERITMSFSNTTLYTWTYEDGRYLRHLGSQNPVAQNFIDRNGTVTQISADVLVVIEGTRYTALPAAGVKGNSVPAIDTVGSGTAAIFHEGVVMTGTWERSSIDQPFALFDENGDPMTVPPGKPWISIFPEHRSVRW